MKLYFYGADQCVTGSCHCLEVGGARILVDCGLLQGQDEVDGQALPFAANEIDYVLVTHAHIDHSGRLPLLMKQGFDGTILTTRLTGELLGIMLADSAHIQESDAEWENRKGERAGRAMVEPLYTTEDAMAVMEVLRTCEYEQEVEVCPGVKAVFTDAGHLLGSASITVTAEENGEVRTIVFSGDIGNSDQPIIRDPQLLEKADYVVMESTYGNRNHETVSDYAQSLADIIERTLGRGGNVIIPAFAVGRTQEVLYYIRELKAKGLVKCVPNFPVYIDSPLAKEATRIFSGDLRGYLDAAALKHIGDGKQLFSFPNLRLTEGAEESRMLNTAPTPKVILSASGMCDAGRIRHHLKHNLWKPENTIVFVGYQAQGSLGRYLLEGAKSVKLFGEEIAVRAELVNLRGLSSHADRDFLLKWIQSFTPHPRHVFVVHGDREIAPIFAQTLVDMGYAAHAPQYTEVYDLIECRQLERGYLPERKARIFASGFKVSAAYQKLLSVGQLVADTIKRAREWDNKSISGLADALRHAIEKFNR